MNNKNISTQVQEKSCCCDDNTCIEEVKIKTSFTKWIQNWGTSILSFAMLLFGIAADQWWQPAFFEGSFRLAWYILAYLPVAWPVLKQGLNLILKGEVFTEFFLMGIATLGAFAIGEFPEAVAVMLFYQVGETFQGMAVRRAKSNIKSLLDLRPDQAHVLREDQYITLDPEKIKVGETIQVKPGEKIPLDGELLSSQGRFNTAALTGESKPVKFSQGGSLLAGMINLENLIEVKVSKAFEESELARILELVQVASSRKAKTEKFIRKFAKVYTPIVTYLAIALTFLPYFFVQNYVFEDWLYRALVFLVISCPCALVVSIPLGYFGGIGAASRNGILFKGANFLDQITKINTVVLDKTGTLTQGVFEVQDIKKMDSNQPHWLGYAASLERKSNHPIAKAITNYAKKEDLLLMDPEEQEEISGMGLKGKIDGKIILVGNQQLMDQYQVITCADTLDATETIIHVAIDNHYVGYLFISDQLKSDALLTTQRLQKMGLKDLIMLSGDNNVVTQKVAKDLKIQQAYGELLPHQKMEKLESLLKETGRSVAFVGDGINDAPVLARADVGIAMGGLGSDAAIETADVVIQTDHPSKIPLAIQIGKKTREIVYQNIGLAFGIKIAVLTLGALGMASLWGAVFADVGVALMAILNAVRIQNIKKFSE
ncbi:heavy metal translocating P-type ATPase [Echinicola jeungdonensis]|uniref:P-type Zn(2+) transporter n=1 Tax=Echinicola jeungdonensis TaxID=709343 RepID=A0ABV5J0H2_9BACT|nr:heavy metal translocating P-type ATPase [Echinicola jeungdonensis]MDN3671071.1 heavy metal translocating P-type ATPase [Echinicola jeungdonensis]